ncbi:MAG: hypothetical protein MJ252_14600 [archaeon]|nr:hypothetical protein [archaeon]
MASSKMDRFNKLSEKISQISKGADSSQNYDKIEQKISNIEDNFNSNLDTLEQKYSLLKDQLAKFSKLIEEDKLAKEKTKNKSIEDLKNFEAKIKTMMQEERDFLKNYVDEAVKKVEGLIVDYNKETKEENDSIKETIEGIKNYLNVIFNLIFLD